MDTIDIELNQALVEKAIIRASCSGFSPAEQIEYWATVGEMIEANPELSYEFIKQAIVAKAEKKAGKLESYHFGYRDMS